MLWEGHLVVKLDWAVDREKESNKAHGLPELHTSQVISIDDEGGVGGSQVSIALQICETDPKQLALPPLPPVLHQTGYANPQKIPLWSIQTPELNVYSNDPIAADFFGRMSAHNVAVLSRIPLVTDHQNGFSFDHVLIYAVKEMPVRICARPLYLYRRDLVVPEASEPAELESSPQPAIPSPGPIMPSQCGIDGPRKALQQTILGAMRLRGIERTHRDYKSIYQHCLRAAEFSLRNCAQPISLEIMRDKVESLLSVLE